MFYQFRMAKYNIVDSSYVYRKQAKQLRIAKFIVIAFKQREKSIAQNLVL